MSQNSANDANFVELGRHIERVGAKLRRLERGTPAYEQSVEDSEDYYERVIQLRQYSIDTLQLEADEARARFSRLCIAVVATIVLAGAGAAVFFMVAL